MFFVRKVIFFGCGIYRVLLVFLSMIHHKNTLPLFLCCLAARKLDKTGID